MRSALGWDSPDPGRVARKPAFREGNEPRASFGCIADEAACFLDRGSEVEVDGLRLDGG